jgi:hypothetical protein
MEKKKLIPLKTKLLTAVNKVLKDNKAVLTKNMNKVVRKSVKRIVKKTDKQFKNAI